MYHIFARLISRDIPYDTSEPRMTAISVKMSVGSVLIVNVYMPTDYGTYDCYEEYLDLCTKIAALFDESEATYLICNW